MNITYYIVLWSNANEHYIVHRHVTTPWSPQKIMVKVFQMLLDPCTGAGGYYLPGSVVSGVLKVETVASAWMFSRIKVSQI